LIAQQQLESILSLLSPDDREIFTARFLHEDSYEEIAARKGIRPDNVRQRISRLVRKLRKA
jgi:RNA polymerase sigma factor (sigma-70 family)